MLLVRRQLPLAWLLVGTLLPDLVDKPIYYGLVAATGRRGAELGLVSGTRTFGHTGLLLVALSLAALIARSPRVAALAWGHASHLVLDVISDVGRGGGEGPGGIHAVLFPLLGAHFPVAHSQSLGEHLLTVRAWSVAAGEIAGAALLVWLLVRRSRRRRAGGSAVDRDRRGSGHLMK